MTINISEKISHRNKKIFIILSIDGINIRKISLRETRGSSTAWNHTEEVLRSLSTSGK